MAVKSTQSTVSNHVQLQQSTQVIQGELELVKTMFEKIESIAQTYELFTLKVDTSTNSF